MVTISISDKIIKKGSEFVVIPRAEYERLLSAKKLPKNIKTKAKVKIDKKHFLYEALQDVKKGRVSGPFKTADELMKHLENK